MKKRLLFWLLTILVLTICAAKAESVITSAEQLNSPGIKIGVSQGATAEPIVRKCLPQADIDYYTDNFIGYIAVAQGKLDAYVYDHTQMQLAIDNGQTGVHLLEETLGEPVRIVVGISPASGIPDLENQVNRFIAEIRADGTLDDMFRRWVLEKNDKMPDIPVPDQSDIHLTVGTTATVPPYSYYEGTSLNGYDIELAHRFAAWLGAELSFQVYDFAGIIPAAVTGKIDVIMSNLQYLPDIADHFLFSETLYEEKLGIMVRGDSPSPTNADNQTDAGTWSAPAGTLSPKAWDGKRMGIVTGTSFDAPTLENYPNSPCFYYNNSSDVLTALISDKIDGFLGDEPTVRVMCQQVPEITYLPEMVKKDDYAFGFGKNSRRADLIRGQFNQMLAEIKQDGTMAALLDKWFGRDEAKKVVDLSTGFSGENGSLNVVTDSTSMPFSYIKDGKPAGLAIELAALFCHRYGYTPVIVDSNPEGCISGLVSGKYDMCASPMSITEERKESIHFSDPFYSGGLVLVLRKADLESLTVPSTKESPAISSGDNVPGAQADTVQDGHTPFWDSIRASFDRTFIRENRWHLFGTGIGTTMLITLLSILFGTVLGFLVFMLCRNGNLFANGMIRFFTWLITGTPMVVLLMILYYIIFGSMKINGIAVAVIGFTLTFGTSVLSLLRMGVGTIDAGQYEAAYALGHTNLNTFFKIILPQAIPHVLPAYQGEIVSLIKATAIVGYIAVQDLTKVGDIVRSRTYEAFFPLIAVTIIYFILEGLFILAVRRIRISIDPRKRSRDAILKGIALHEQN